MRHCPFRPFDFKIPRGPHNNCGDRNCAGNARSHPIMPHSNLDSKIYHPNILSTMGPYDEEIIKSMDPVMNEILKPVYTQNETNLSHGSPWTGLSPHALLEEEKKDHVFVSDHKFQIKCRTEGYTPEELTVRTLNNFIMVEGRHEVKTMNSESSRYFFKKWEAPDGVLVDRVVCYVNKKDGYLQIDAPKLAAGELGVTVPISFSFSSPFGSPNKFNSPFGSPNEINSPFGSPPAIKISSPFGSPFGSPPKKRSF